MSCEVLCVNSQELEDLREGKIETLKARFYKCEICNDPVNELKKISPFVVFYRSGSKEMNFVKYKEVPNTSCENYEDKYSVGFGSYVYFKEDIVYTDLTIEDDVDTYIMSLSDLVHTVVKAGKREIIEELGDGILSEFYIEKHMSKCFFVDNNSEEASDKVKAIIAMSIDTDRDTFNKIVSLNRSNSEGHIDTIGKLSVLIDDSEEVTNDNDLQSASIACVNHILIHLGNTVSD